jgi:hypothetical protein
MFFNENFLHFIWQNTYFFKNKLHTTDGEPVEILHPGFANHLSGPDFLDAKIRIGDRIWFGTVEIHVESSAWYAHHHETDPAYDTVILHVVYENNMPVFNSHGVKIPAMELKGKIPEGILDAYRLLASSAHPLKCHYALPEEPVLYEKWLERLFIERLERKVRTIHRHLEASVNDWEGVLYRMLLRYFGASQNTDAFETIATLVPWRIFKKYTSRPDYTEALLLGTAGLLDENHISDEYTARLFENYKFLRTKHELESLEIPLKFGRMRPVNFPSVRLAQFAALYARHPDLFDRLIRKCPPEQKRQMLKIEADGYWKKHYLPGKKSASKPKKTGKQFIDMLLLNVIVPVQFAYGKYLDDPDLTESATDLARLLPPENNRIVRFYNSYGFPVNSAASSQAVLQLKNFYCNRNKCLSCDIGKKIISRENFGQN